MSISGGRAFVKNDLTGADGRTSVSGLAPGQYFVRPLLKEYAFSPATRTLTVAEGSEAAAEFTAERTAFSVHGAVRTLNGEAVQGVDVSAVPAAGLAPGQQPEAAQTDAAGAYRIRGLAPGQRYTVTVSSSAWSAVPASRSVAVGREDARGEDFTVIATGTWRAVSGVVDADEATRQALEVVLTSAADGSTRRYPLGIARFFEFTGLPAGQYSVRAVSPLPQHGGCVSQTATADISREERAHVELAFRCPSLHEETAVAGRKTSVLSLVVGVAIVVAVFERERIIEAVLEAVRRHRAARSPSSRRAMDESFLPAYLHKQQQQQQQQQRKQK
eukprot:m51a1_g13440 putative nodal modulator 1-like (331) ;mRNA; r:494-1486